MPQPAPQPLTQARWLKLPEGHPDAAFLRSDAYANMLAVARAVGWSADWETLRSRPTLARIMQVTGLSRRSVQRHTRWLEERGLLRVLEEGTTPQFSPGILRRGDANLARMWELADPAASEAVTGYDQGQRMALLGDIPAGMTASRTIGGPLPLDLTGTPSVPVVSCSKDQPPTRPRELESTGQPPWPLNLKPHQRRDRLKVAESLRREHLVLRRISAPALASIARPWFALGWTPSDVLWAAEHLPSGHLHHRGHPVRYPRAWLAYRLAFWAGHPPHSVQLAERAMRHRARVCAYAHTDMRGTAPPPEWHDARAALERRVVFPARSPQRKA